MRNKNVFWPVFILLTCSAFDSMRDSLIDQASWWIWHIIKWIAFYPPMIYVWMKLPGWRWKVGVAAGALAVWEFTYITFNQ
jgi:hypothetical protein